MKKKFIALVTAAVAMVPFTGVGTANAAALGALAFECTAKLSAFPTSAGSGVCEGSAAPALAAGVIAGTNDTGGPFVITGAGAFSANFTYSEACVAGEPPVVGAAQGTASVTGMTALNNGVLTTARIDISFTWQRAGLVAAIVIDDGTITFANGGSADIDTSAGTAAFAPLLNAGSVCPDGGPLQAVVAGSAVLEGT